MKGIAHFASGLCVASFVPGVAAAAANGDLSIALGGACAMLPDFLDFRFARFLEKPDAEIVPDLEHPDPQALADAVAAQLRAVAKDGRPRIVHLHPARRSLIDWILYTVRFDPARGEVGITMLGADPAPSASAPAGALEYGYDGAIDISELGGPSFRFSPGPRGVQIDFLPWHRAWSHSLLLALGLGALLALLLGPTAGLVGALGYATHVLEDQLGYMGSALFWPLFKGRSRGLGLLHAGDTIPNMVTVWLSLTLILLNLDRALPTPLLAMGPYLAFAVALPTIVLLGIYTQRKLRAVLAPGEAEQQKDLVAEASDGS